MRRFPLLPAICLLLALSSPCLAVDYSVRVDAPSALTPLLTEHLPLITEPQDAPVSDSDLEVLLRTTPDAARKLLETEGYFDAQVTVRDEGGTPRRIQVSVDPGKPVLIGQIDIELDGPIRQDSDVAARRAALLAQWPTVVGNRFRQADWDAAKAVTLQGITADRYPLARIAASSQVDIDPSSHTAHMKLVIDSGPSIRFGDLQIRGLKRYPASLVHKLADFRPGDPYRLQVLLDYQAALQHSSQFSAAVVSADLQRVSDEGRAPIVVDLVEFPLKKLELGLTYNTDVGPGTRVGLDHNNLFGTGLSGSSVLSWDQSQQSLNFGMTLPRTADGYVHTVTAALKQTNIQNLITQSQEVGAWRVHTRANDEWRVGLNFIREAQHAVNEDNQVNRALLPSIGLTRRDVDNLLRPRSGYLLDGMVSGTLGNWLSSTNYLRVYGRAVQYWTPSAPSWGTFLGRLELGRVWASDSSKVPSSQLFRAGGINSVRGYEYQSLGLPGANNAVVGGAVMVTGTVEYQVPVYKDFSLAVFSDAGNVSESWSSFSLKRSYGIGVRWFSPVAPLSFDMARPQGSKTISWNMSLGLAF
ncbi:MULTISPECIES: autotransporter assembly complex family protein [unclassified Paludibacterium]|uniref:autotransporter assembly complex protein TamA n=1 Tax=unclassified Paludibacterium TaxID=2618429 RepID=UPI001C047FC2|nr:autotransporter assembly complex family protein [Paludibacterium sp. B53371]BEV72870.1 autotransporter assembly complex family protein [Paludibacterium sp. THUN1379]